MSLKLGRIRRRLGRGTHSFKAKDETGPIASFASAARGHQRTENLTSIKKMRKWMREFPSVLRHDVRNEKLFGPLEPTFICVHHVVRRNPPGNFPTYFRIRSILTSFFPYTCLSWGEAIEPSLAFSFKKIGGTSRRSHSAGFSGTRYANIRRFSKVGMPSPSFIRALWNKNIRILEQ